MIRPSSLGGIHLPFAITDVSLARLYPGVKEDVCNERDAEYAENQDLETGLRTCLSQAAAFVQRHQLSPRCQQESFRWSWCQDAGLPSLRRSISVTDRA